MGDNGVKTMVTVNNCVKATAGRNSSVKVTSGGNCSVTEVLRTPVGIITVLRP